MENTKNKLAKEKSPYLLQHAENPVNWYPWNDRAFQKAKDENKPIFVSIGYSTCHWCHVMAHESFEDKEVAQLLNEYFVSIKVDREERPDIDSIYMKACQRLTGRGGWPLTIIITPDKKPFFAATYLPKDNLIKVCSNVANMWNEDKDRVISSADKITENLKDEFVDEETNAEKVDLTNKQIAEKAFNHLKNSYDKIYGGFSTAPKFPTPHRLLFLIRYWKRTGESKALEMVEKTLVEMRKGGIYDHIGYGFHRYSTDDKWRVPHFEKMLYDQGLLLYTYIEAYKVTGNPLFKKTISEIIDYVKREMTSDEGGFYSAEDADSEGVEGKFYKWSSKKIKEVLSEKEAEIFMEVYNIKKENEDKPGERNYNSEDDFQTLYIKDMDEFLEYEKGLNSIRKKLFSVRDKRLHPHKDDKILTDWNGLMVAALSRAAEIDKEYIELAEKAVDFILDNLYDSRENTLYHRYREGDSAIKGNLDDYSFFIWGLLELYEVTFKPQYLEKAVEFNNYLLANFWDNENGGFYFTEKGIENSFLRQKEYYDGAIPSGNSVAAWNLIRLSHFTANKEMEEKSKELLYSFAYRLEGQPDAYCQALLALQSLKETYYDIIIVGDDREEINKFLKIIKSKYIPNKSVVIIDEDDREDLIEISDYYSNYKMKNRKTTVYICKDYTCSLPVNDISGNNFF